MRLRIFALLWLTACAHTSATPNSPVHAVEVDEDGKEKAVPAAGLTEIDVNSSVALRLDEAKLRERLSHAVELDPARIKAIQGELAALQEAANKQAAALAYIKLRLEQPLSGAEVAPDVRRLAELENAALKALEALLSADELEAVLSYRGHASYDQAIARLGARMTDVQAQLDAIEAQLARVRFRLQATLVHDGQSTPIHLDGYDDMPAGSASLYDRFAIPDDVAQQLDKAKATAAQIVDLRNAAKALGALAQQRAKELADKLRDSLDALSKLESLVAALEKAPASGTRLKTVSTTARALLGAAKPLRTPCGDAWARLRELLAGERTAIALSGDPALAACAAAIRANEQVLADAAGKLRSAVDEALADPALDEELRARLRGVAGSIAGALWKDVATWWAGVQDSFGRGLGMGDVPEFASLERTRDRGYRELAATTIDLTRTAREPGDRLHYRAAVVVDGAEAEQWSSPVMRVVVNGLRLDISAAVMFVRAFERRAGDAAFPAAPAVTAALHYHAPRRADQPRSWKLWNLLDPGLGAHVAYLDLGNSRIDAAGQVLEKDPAAEIGLGGTLQLFGDVVQAGVGYDLQVERAYWFVGIGLQTATALGFTVPTNGG